MDEVFRRASSITEDEVLDKGYSTGLMMVSRFDEVQLDARDRTWYYGLPASNVRIVRWLMDNWCDVYDGVSISTIARATWLNQGTVRLAVAALEQFGYVRISWRNGRMWKVIPMHGFDLSEVD